MMPAITEQSKPAIARARQGLIAEIVRTALIAVLAFALIRLIILPYKVDGPSMQPTLQNQELLLVGRQAYVHFDLNSVLNILPFVDREGQDLVYPLGAPSRGDIVILHPPVVSDEPFVKRIIGVPGDHLSFRDGAVYVNGEKLDEPYLNGIATYFGNGGATYEIDVPAGKVFVMGDNRGNSRDSRAFGLVSEDELIGKAWVSLWPFDRLGIIRAPNY